MLKWQPLDQTLITIHSMTHEQFDNHCNISINCPSIQSQNNIELIFNHCINKRCKVSYLPFSKLQG